MENRWSNRSRSKLGFHQSQHQHCRHPNVDRCWNQASLSSKELPACVIRKWSLDYLQDRTQRANASDTIFHHHATNLRH